MYASTAQEGSVLNLGMPALLKKLQCSDSRTRMPALLKRVLFSDSGIPALLESVQCSDPGMAALLKRVHRSHPEMSVPLALKRGQCNLDFEILLRNVQCKSRFCNVAQEGSVQ
jgi:hypothetical protein